MTDRCINLQFGEEVRLELLDVSAESRKRLLSFIADLCKENEFAIRAYYKGELITIDSNDRIEKTLHLLDKKSSEPKEVKQENKMQVTSMEEELLLPTTKMVDDNDSKEILLSEKFQKEQSVLSSIKPQIFQSQWKRLVLLIQTILSTCTFKTANQYEHLKKLLDEILTFGKLLTDFQTYLKITDALSRKDFQLFYRTLYSLYPQFTVDNFYRASDELDDWRVWKTLTKDKAAALKRQIDLKIRLAQLKQQFSSYWIDVEDLKPSPFNEDDRIFFASGGSSDVYSVDYKEQKCAAKLFRKVLGEFSENFATEKKYFDTCRNVKGMIRFVGITAQGSKIAIIMEAAKGSLAMLKGQTPLSIDKGLKYIIQITETVKNLHDQGVQWCRLKTKNILFRGNPNENRLALGDFAFAKGSGFSSNNSSTTLDLRAPETFEETKVVTPKADIYSIGALLFMMISKNASHLPSVVELTKRCTAEDPSARPNSQELLQQLCQLELIFSSSSSASSSSSLSSSDSSSSSSSSSS